MVRRHPEDDLEKAERELRLMLKTATISFQAPDWFTSPDHAAWGWLLLGDHAMPLYRRGDELWASTSMDRGAMGGELRAIRNKAKQWRREGRRRGRVAQKTNNGRPRSGPKVGEWEDGAA